MNPGKKILSLLFKLSLGLACLFVVYYRIQQDFGQAELLLLRSTLISFSALVTLGVCILLIPLNWGLESLKWQLVTKPVESVSYYTATRSVYSGICAGNFAPGRATEFLGKILYFSDQNKTRVSVLHFLNGMVQLGVTLMAGLVALFIRAQEFSKNQSWLLLVLGVTGIVLLLFFVFALLRTDWLLGLITGWLHKSVKGASLHFDFPFSLWNRLFWLSVLRFLVFSSQFYVLLKLFSPDSGSWSILPGLALYFMITSILPMLSVFEAAIRSAVAMLVMSNSGLSPVTLTSATVILWLLNIVMPSLIGYVFLLQMKFDFKLLYRKPR